MKSGSLAFGCGFDFLYSSDFSEMMDESNLLFLGKGGSHSKSMNAEMTATVDKTF